MKWTCEVIRNKNYKYSAVMVEGGVKVEGLPENVDYNTLREAIRRQTGVCMLKCKDMLFERHKGLDYAFIDNTHHRPGKDCRVSLADRRNGYAPKF